MIPVVVLGAGPAGLGAALQLARRGFDVTVLERNTAAGGNAGSFEIDGLRVDYGSHRLHPSCPARILADIRSMLGADLLDRERHGRIRLGGRWLQFPLETPDILRNAPRSFLWGAMKDALWKPRPKADPPSFASVLERGLGGTICREFYFPYAEKIWGLPPDELDAEQARRRVSAGSLGSLLRRLAGGGRRRYYYPKRGFGQISEAYLEAATEAGARVLFKASVAAVEIDGGRAAAVRTADGGRFPARHVFSTIPLSVLGNLVQPPAPAAALRYRAMTLVYLVLDTDRFTEFDAHYFPERDIPFTRLSEPKNYGLQEAPGTTVLCAELPCDAGDAVWQAAETDLLALVMQALEGADLPVRARPRRVVVRRLEQAYPIYARGYREHFDRLDTWAGGVDGLVTLGRQGLFAHDNTHHTLAMAYAAVDCLTEAGGFDRERWGGYRREFESHVVED